MGKTFSEGKKPCSPGISRRIPRAGPGSTLRVTGGTDKMEVSEEGRVDLGIELVIGRELCLLVAIASPGVPPLLRRAELDMYEAQQDHLGYGFRERIVILCFTGASTLDQKAFPSASQSKGDFSIKYKSRLSPLRSEK